MPKKNISDEVTPENIYLNRRFFLKSSIFAATGLTTAGLYRYFQPNSDKKIINPVEIKNLDNEIATSFQAITNYNNFYEFTTNKEQVSSEIKNWQINDWSLEISGLVENPIKLTLKDIESLKTEERIYRFRCVEGWSMVIPWQGIPLSALIEKAKPLSSGKYVAFETFFSEVDMPNAASAGIPFPYIEGLRMDEALHPLTLLATGLYGKKLPKQNGAPIRLVVPWKYGFKSIKSIVSIKIIDQEPKTTWNIISPQEYGFFSNVNPAVDHPRWSQSTERRIGENRRRPTQLFNGYEKEVSHLYTAMDLKKYF